MEKSRPPLFKMILTVALVLVALYGALVATALLAVIGAGLGFTLLFLVVYADFLVTLILLMWAPNMLKRLYYIPIVITLAGAAWLGYTAGYTVYGADVAVLAEHPVDPARYEPFRPASTLARLDHAASLQLLEDLPRLDCATALYPVAAAFVEAIYPTDEYPADDPDGLLCQTGTNRAYDRLIGGEVDLIIAPGPTDEQILAADAAGFELRLTPIGREAFVFFAHADNPVENLTLGEIRGIYSGSISNWREVGGRDEPIRAYQRAEGSGSQTALHTIMGGAAAMTPIRDEAGRTADYHNHPGSIGFTFRSYAVDMVVAGQIKLLGLDGIMPPEEAIRTGHYPVATKFFAVTAGSPNPNIQPFIDWMTSAEGQFLVDQSGYIPLRRDWQ